MSAAQERVELRAGTDPNKEIESLALRWRQHGGGDALIASLVAPIIRDLSGRGEQLVAIGSVFEVTRVIDIDGVRVTIDAHYGLVRKGTLARLRDALKG